MFFVVNLMFVAAAVVLVLVIAATSSIPPRHDAGDDSPEGEWIGASGLPVATMPQHAPPTLQRAARQRRVAAPGLLQ